MTPAQKNVDALLKRMTEGYRQGLEAEKAKYAGKNPGPPKPGEFIEEVDPDRMDD